MKTCKHCSTSSFGVLEVKSVETAYLLENGKKVKTLNTEKKEELTYNYCFTCKKNITEEDLISQEKCVVCASLGVLNEDQLCTTCEDAVNETIKMSPVEIAKMLLEKKNGEKKKRSKPKAKPKTEPVVEETEPVVEPVVEAVVEPVVEAVVEEVVEPVIEEPVVAEVVEPIVEPVTEPVAEVTISPVEEKVAEPSNEWDAIESTVDFTPGYVDADISPVSDEEFDAAIDDELDSLLNPVADIDVSPVEDIDPTVDQKSELESIIDTVDAFDFDISGIMPGDDKILC